MACNARFAAYLAASGLTQEELAERLNVHIEHLTGRLGTLTARHIRNWLTGKTRWPQEKQRRALAAEFGVTAEELGFTPRRAAERELSAPEIPTGLEDAVKRRYFAVASVAAIGATALPAAAATNPTPRIGMAQVNALEQAFAGIVLSDDTQGGTVNMEAEALAFADQAMFLQNAGGMLPERVRSRLYYLAAAFTGFGVWASIDQCKPQRAQHYMERALTLARLSGDSEIELRVWSHGSFLARQRGDVNESVAMAQKARYSSACRRDPFFASLTSARLSSCFTEVSEARAARRALTYAHSAFGRADHSVEREPCYSFYDQAELHGLSALTLTGLKEHAEAEAHLHQTLTLLRPQYQRNRSYYTAQLALTQLRQGAVEAACDTALTVLPEHAASPLGGRTSRLLHRFNQGLTRSAPGARCTSDWTDRYTARKRGI
ncbi:multiprotein-bridging factor 1 family protein [Streptomyces sp. NPDC057638]|uniref:helix-turn-helix domain-containing protein n=1 Tax=Streptomyces sp. NPDC057638 TaxID=3346190 RepID=UPI0036BAF094